MADKLNWVELNPAKDLSPEAKKAYDGYKGIYAKAKEAREAFETIMEAEAEKRNIVTPETRLAFSYNFGRLSLAIAPKEAVRTSKAVPGWAGLTA